jgi:hypothetical protein
MLVEYLSDYTAQPFACSTRIGELDSGKEKRRFGIVKNTWTSIIDHRPAFNVQVRCSTSVRPQSSCNIPGEAASRRFFFLPTHPVTMVKHAEHALFIPQEQNSGYSREVHAHPSIYKSKRTCHAGNWACPSGRHQLCGTLATQLYGNDSYEYMPLLTRFYQRQYFLFLCRTNFPRGCARRAVGSNTKRGFHVQLIK